MEPELVYIPLSMEPKFVYLPHLEINGPMAQVHLNNCAVRCRTADGVSVGPCWHFLTDGTTCPVHGVVRVPAGSDLLESTKQS